jgi:hypothetical protein
VGRGGSFTWFDLDNDGDLDYLVAGAYFVPGGNGLVEARMHLYRNDAPGVNRAPGRSSSLQATPGGGAVALSWSPAADDHTAARALTYDLQVFAQGQAVPAGLRLPQPGNLGAVTQWVLRGLAPGSYAWSVQAVDSALSGGPRAQGTFTVGATAPPVVSDGRNGAPLKAAKLDASGARLTVSFDTAGCPGAVDHHIVYGTRDQLPPAPGGPYALAGSACAIGPSPFTWTGSPDPGTAPGLIWFLAIANDGLSTEGPWGVGGDGADREGPGPGGSSGECGMVAKSLENPCGR